MNNDTVDELPPSELAEEPYDRTFSRMIDTFFSSTHPFFCTSERVWIPPTDVFETADAIHIKMELAGVREQDVEVKVNDNFLIIRGRRVDDKVTKRENYHLMEIHYGTFERVFGLPLHMEVKNVQAKLQDGILLVVVPKDRRLREYSIEIE